SLYTRAWAIDSSWSSENRTNSDRFGNITEASTLSRSMSRRMCSGSPSGVGPGNCRYWETVQPSNPTVCNFLKSLCPPGTSGSSSVNSSSQRARSLSCLGRRVLNRSTGSIMCVSPETTNSFNNCRAFLLPSSLIASADGQLGWALRLPRPRLHTDQLVQEYTPLPLPSTPLIGLPAARAQRARAQAGQEPYLAFEQVNKAMHRR